MEFRFGVVRDIGWSADVVGRWSGDTRTQWLRSTSRLDAWWTIFSSTLGTSARRT
jgi:hypothetical protein